MSELLKVKQVADFLGVSVRQVWNLRTEKLLPQPVRLGRSSRWRRSELLAWIDSGCPSLAEQVATNTGERRTEAANVVPS